MLRLLLWSSLCWLLFSCQTETNPSWSDVPLDIKTPAGIPQIVYPVDNAPTEARIAFGRTLFYHTGLSKDQKTSCGSCHVLSSAFTDGRAVSAGDNGAFAQRNTPTLTNLAWAPYLMSEGGVPSLELQALAPLHESAEMGTNMMLAVDRLNQSTELRNLNQKAYGRDSIDPYTITRALACFQRTFISLDSRYDQYKVGKAELSEKEKKGMQLFFDKKNACAECHREPFFTDYAFYDVGLHTTDPGLERKTHQKNDLGKFKTPTLRNIAVTAPYMHNGSINTLEEVIAFYNRGGLGTALQDPRIHALHLSLEDQQALLAFLHTLTDWNFLQNQQLTPLSE